MASNKKETKGNTRTTPDTQSSSRSRHDRTTEPLDNANQQRPRTVVDGPRSSQQGFTEKPKEYEIRRRQESSTIFQKFCAFGPEEYANIASFAGFNQDVFDEDPRELQSLARKYIKERDGDRVWKIVQRMIMLNFSWRKSETIEDQLKWLDNLTRSRELQDELNEKCRETIVALGEAISRQPRPISDSQERYAGQSNALLSKANALLERPASSDFQSTPTGTIDAPTDDTMTVFSDMDSLNGGPQLSGEQIFMGPKTYVDKHFPAELRQPLRKGYKVHYGEQEIKRVFSRGCVFAIFWHENLGHNPSSKARNIPTDSNANLKALITQTENGEYIYSHIRRFIVVGERHGFSVAIPITSYGGKGLSAKKIVDREHTAHGIVYDQHSEPQRMSGEAPFTKDPVQLVLIQGERLSASSRIFYAKPSSIDHNVKVKYLGKVIRDHVGRFMQNYRSEN